MANLAEIESRLITVENKILGAVEIPKGDIDIDDTKIADKTGWIVRGIRANINSGRFHVGLSTVPDPTSDSDYSYFIYKSIT